MEWGPGNQKIRPSDPCFKRSVPQCNELRKMVFEISRSGAFPARPFVARLIHLNTLGA
jgi:hypothetical protein